MQKINTSERGRTNRQTTNPLSVVSDVWLRATVPHYGPVWLKMDCALYIFYNNNNNDNDRLTAFDPGQPG